MPKVSAGLVMYRRRQGKLEFLLVHPGGPFWKGKDAGAWSIPKGLVNEGEDPLAAAQRETEEELGSRLWGSPAAAPPTAPFVPLGSIKLKSGKLVHAWAVPGEFDP